MNSSESVIQAIRLDMPLPLTAQPESTLWRRTLPVVFDGDNFGHRVDGMTTLVHAAWTREDLYVLFVNHYKQLHLKSHPILTISTPCLWEWDVAELFICATSARTGNYKEFEISPQGEWLDLDIDHAARDRRGDPNWSSGFEVVASIDHEAKIWYGAMRIPFACLHSGGASPGMIFRANLFRSQGPKHQLLAWQPSMSETFHVPERFGQLVLVE